MCNHVYIVVYYCHLSSFYIVSCFLLGCHLSSYFVLFDFIVTVYLSDTKRILGKSAGPGQRISDKIDKYCERVQKTGTFLEVIDAEIFCRQAGKMLAIGVDTHNSVLEVKPSTAFWYTLMAGQEDGVPFPEVDRSDPNTWCLISCHAKYDSSAVQRNHWIPAVFKEQVPPEVYTELTVSKCKIFNEKLTDITKMVKSLEAKKDELMKLEPSLGDNDSRLLEILSEIDFWKDELKVFLCSLLCTFYASL